MVLSTTLIPVTFDGLAIYKYNYNYDGVGTIIIMESQ